MEWLEGLGLLGLFIGTCICYLFGTLWLAYQTGIGFNDALLIGVIPYVPFDVGKIGAALMLHRTVARRLNRMQLHYK